MVKRLVWSGLLAGVGALSTIVAQRAATFIWRRVSTRSRPSERARAARRRAR